MYIHRNIHSGVAVEYVARVDIASFTPNDSHNNVLNSIYYSYYRQPVVCIIP